MIWILTWLGSAVATAVVAEFKGRRVMSWFLLGGVLGPLALAAVLVMKGLDNDTDV
ncbi:hypothetical protein [Pelagovum pacificum]|nr:hypothetical protein [Pelagovum pacificum]QQA43931.1 hypothetical protein I8N54_04960 [Pelagovum pacificum]